LGQEEPAVAILLLSPWNPDVPEVVCCGVSCFNQAVHLARLLTTLGSYHIAAMIKGILKLSASVHKRRNIGTA